MKIRKTIVALMVLLMVFSSVLFVNAEEAKDLPKAFVKVQSALNLRDGPGTIHNVISKLSPGDIVYVEESLENGWSKIHLEDETVGYVNNSYIVTPSQDAQSYELISAAVITSKSSANRDFNMARACEKINGLTLAPGDEFNWYGTDGTDGVVGVASKANGYKQANVISGGKYVKGYGGGVCQVSTSVYNCILKLGIDPTERHQHSLTSSYVAKGMDATVAYPSKNFVFSNTLDYSIMFEAYTDGGQVIMLAYRVIE